MFFNLDIQSIILFIKKDITSNFEIKCNKELINDNFKYQVIIQKLKSFLLFVLPKINNIKQLFIKNYRLELFKQTNHIFKKSKYKRYLFAIYNLSIHKDKTKFTILKQTIHYTNYLNYVVKLLNFINDSLKKQVLFKIDKNKLDIIISKILFYTSLI